MDQERIKTSETVIIESMFLYYLRLKKVCINSLTMKKVLLSFSILLIFCNLTYAQTVYDGFEGSGNITTWTGVSCSVNTNLANPYQEGINTSSNVLVYHDTGGQYANAFFDIHGNFQLSASAEFSFKIYVPSSGLTGSQTNQVSLKLQNNKLDQPWSTQATITKPIQLDQWQTVTFNFASDNYVNTNLFSKPPVQRIDFNQVVIQVNGENNNDHVKAYIDDFSYSNNLVVLSTDNRFEFIGLPSEQEGADVLSNMLNKNYSRIVNSLNTELSEKIYVYVYPGNDALHTGIGWPDAPDWVVGTARGSDRIDIVNPYKSSSHNYNQVSGIVIHEMVHCFVFGLADDTYPPIWLNEGAATYLAAETQPEFSSNLCGDINQNSGRILTLDELNNGQTFGNIGGYGFSCNIVEFIINRLGGSEVLGNFIKSKGMDYSILGYSNKQEFQDEWNQYIYINYNCNFSGIHAAFLANENTGVSPFMVNFTDFSVHENNSITRWSWDFDNDGIIESTSKNPVWTYSQPGNYTVKLTVSDGSQTSTYTKNNYIEVLDPQGNLQSLFNKDFEDRSLTSGGWFTANVKGNQVWEVPNETFGRNNSYCAKMSGYDNGAKANENWLISPAFSPDSYQNLNLSFWNTSGHIGPNLELYVTNSYTGDPGTTSWTKIENVQWHDGNTFWEWTFSGMIDLSDLTGSASHIAFKYRSKEEESAATWEVDDVLLTGRLALTSNNHTANATFSLSPNPTSGNVYIYSETYANVSIYSIQGEKVFENRRYKEGYINITGFKKGVYLVVLKNSSGTVTKKLIIE